MTQPVSIVTGLNGQDGYYLAHQLIERGHRVYGVVRRTSGGYQIPDTIDKDNFELVIADVTDLVSLEKLCKLARPDYFFNMAAQSHVGLSFSQPLHTAQVTGLGTLNCLEAIRSSGIHTRFLQASTSELYGGLSNSSYNEASPFHPRSPYGTAKLFGYWSVINYRESYKMFACNSICFNHESPRRGPEFVTRKISMAVARIKKGLQKQLSLGNLDSFRDWGYAPDFTRGMIDILTSSTPDDYVLATGETHSIRGFCELAFGYVGLDYRDHVVIDPAFYRPAEVDRLQGDYSKIKSTLGWKPSVSFPELVNLMVQADLDLLP